MVVYDLVIDEDMTTRSSPQSVGLFATETAAREALEAMELEEWMWRSIQPREIIGSSPEEFSKALVYIQKCLKETLYERDLVLEKLAPYATITWPKGKLKIEMNNEKHSTSTNR